MRIVEQSSYETISNKLHSQTALQGWLDQFQFNFFVTANFNCDTSEHSARNALRRWHGMIDRQLLGPKWHKKSGEQRTLFFAFPEHPNSNRHYHMMLRTNEPMVLARIAEPKWIKIVPSGSMHLDLIDQIGDRQATTSYATKDIWKYDLIDQFIISSEFSTRT